MSKFLALFWNYGNLNDLFTLQAQSIFFKTPKKIRRYKCDNELIYEFINFY